MNADRDQIVLPGTKAPEPQRLARLFWKDHKWRVEIPTPFGKPATYTAGEWRDALRFLNLVTRRRRRRDV